MQQEVRAEQADLPAELWNPPGYSARWYPAEKKGYSGTSAWARATTGARFTVGTGHTRVEIRVANRGYLGTYGVPSAHKLPLSEPLRVTTAGNGVTPVAPAESIVEIGHLDGWGAGLYGGASIFMPWTRGNAHERFVTFVVEGRGTLSVTVGSCRVGYRTVDVEVG